MTHPHRLTTDDEQRAKAALLAALAAAPAGLTVHQLILKAPELTAGQTRRLLWVLVGSHRVTRRWTRIGTMHDGRPRHGYLWSIDSTLPPAG